MKTILWRLLALTLGSVITGGNLDVNAGGALSVGAGAGITSGGDVLLTTSRNITMNTGSSITTLDGDVTLSANQQALATTGNFVGILLNDADILLNSPDIDNMPLSLIEAQAAGLPIVSTWTGGIPYIVKDGGTGLLVAPGDHEAMARASMRLLEEPGLALRLTSAARQSCLEQFSWPAVEAAWVRTYRELAASVRPATSVPA